MLEAASGIRAVADLREDLHAGIPRWGGAWRSRPNHRHDLAVPDPVSVTLQVAWSIRIASLGQAFLSAFQTPL
jgi:hypothetical protein